VQVSEEWTLSLFNDEGLLLHELRGEILGGMNRLQKNDPDPFIRYS
jgi:hypothetical protein